MKHSILMAAFAATVGLAACDKPTVVNVPATTTPVPGPAGPSGADGSTGAPGTPGRPGDSTTIIVTPPASAPAN